MLLAAGARRPCLALAACRCLLEFLFLCDAGEAKSSMLREPWRVGSDLEDALGGGVVPLEPFRLAPVRERGRRNHEGSWFWGVNEKI